MEQFFSNISYTSLNTTYSNNSQRTLTLTSSPTDKKFDIS